MYVGVAPYETLLSVSNSVPSSFFHVIVYLFTVLVTLGVIVILPTTLPPLGTPLSELNVYVYCVVFALFVNVLVVVPTVNVLPLTEIAVP